MGVSVATTPARTDRVVEIVGPPGAGKTTLRDALRLTSPDVHVPDLRRPGYLAWFAATALTSTPLPLAPAHPCRLRWRERMIMIHLGALTHVAPPSRAVVTVYDQGPVFMLTRLHACGFDHITAGNVRRWWDATLGRWASILDTVIYLDAPESVLVQRIRTRAKWHLTKDRSESEAYEFLRTFRRTSRLILSRLGVRVLEFDTSQHPVTAIVPGLLQEMHPNRIAMGSA
jgi:hypothetical protein